MPPTGGCDQFDAQPDHFFDQFDANNLRCVGLFMMINMMPKIPVMLKTTVVQLYLQGVSRNRTAAETGISQGAVLNIIAEWRKGLTYPLVDDLRELSIALNKLGISAPQCAKGLRVSQMLQALGLEDEDFTSFISEIFSRCRDIDLNPAKIVSNTKQLLELAKSIPVSQIPSYIRDKTDEKRILEEDIRRLREQESHAKADLERAVSHNRAFLNELKQFHDFKTQLMRVGIHLEDTNRFVNSMESLRDSGFDVDKLVVDMSNFRASSKLRAELEMEVESWKVNLQQIKNDWGHYEELAAQHRQKVLIYEELEKMGFNIPKLKLISNTIKELAIEYNIAYHIAIEMFFADLTQTCEKRIVGDSKLQNLTREMNTIKTELSSIKARSSIEDMTSKVREISRMGFEKQQVHSLATVLEASSIDMDELLADLAKYRNLKNVIKNLNNQKRSLEIELDNSRESKRLKYGPLSAYFETSRFRYIPLSSVDFQSIRI